MVEESETKQHYVTGLRDTIPINDAIIVPTIKPIKTAIERMNPLQPKLNG